MSTQPKNEKTGDVRGGKRGIWNLAYNNPGVALSLGYAIACGAGMLYESLFFKPFGINILDHADLTDFLTAGLTNRPILVAYGVFLLGVLLYRPTVGSIDWSGNGTRSKRVYRWIEEKLLKFGYVYIFIAVLAVLVQFWDIEKEYHGLLCSNNSIAVVTLRSPATSPANEIPMRVVRSTSRVLLGFDPDDLKGLCNDGEENAGQVPELIGIPHSAIFRLDFDVQEKQ